MEITVLLKLSRLYKLYILNGINNLESALNKTLLTSSHHNINDIRCKVYFIIGGK